MNTMIIKKNPLTRLLSAMEAKFITALTLPAGLHPTFTQATVAPLFLNYLTGVAIRAFRSLQLPPNTATSAVK